MWVKLAHAHRNQCFPVVGKGSSCLEYLAFSQLCLTVFQVSSTGGVMLPGGHKPGLLKEAKQCCFLKAFFKDTASRSLPFPETEQQTSGTHICEDKQQASQLKRKL